MANKPTILIIEDHNDLREMFAFGLSVGGYDTLMAADGPEGLELYEANHPDVVLVDVMLPSAIKGLNGYQISAKIKQGNPDAIVVVMTGRDDLPDLRLLDSHADKILIKPLTVDQVISEIEYIKGKRDVMNPKVMGAPNGQGGFLNFTREQSMLTFAFIMALVIFVGWINRIDAHYQDQAAGIARIEDGLKSEVRELRHDIGEERDSRGTAFATVDSKIAKVQGTVDALKK